MSIPVDLEPLPNSYTFGKVVGRVIHGVADTAEDSNDKPQARAAAGKVHFDPKNTLTKTPAGADYTALVLQGRETANLSASGRVLDAEGRQGIWLIAGVWSVSFELETPGAKIKGFDIEVTAAHTDEAPLDLATVAPYTAPGALTVKTMLIPTGGTDGQVLTLDESSGTLVWTDNGSGVASWAEIAALPDTPDLVTGARTVAGKPLSADVTLTKGDVGLSNVDNTADAAKPISAATQAALNAKADAAATTSALAAKADLVGGVIPTGQLPPLAINETFTAASQAAMLALTAQRGDMAIRTDNGRTYVLSTDSPSTLADWKEVQAAGQVVSVAGKTGTVALVKADVGLSNVDNTSDAAKPVSTAQAAADALRGLKTETEAVVMKNEGTGTWGARPTGYLRVRWFGTDPGPGTPPMLAGDIREIPVT